MNYIMCLPFMIFCHVVDDYYLQGILAKLKQKSYWENMEGYNSFYKYDYIVALLFHGFSWAFMVMLPVLVYYQFNLPVEDYLIVLIGNAISHAYIDNAKANKKYINLIFDQSLHLFQIVYMWYLFM